MKIPLEVRHLCIFLDQSLEATVSVIVQSRQESISVEFTLFLKDIFQNQLKQQGFGQSCAPVIAG